MTESIHETGQIHAAGEPLETAKAAVIMLHGRGASAQSILSLIDGIGIDQIAFLAPQAADNTWYPYSFLQPIASNEPYLTSALNTVKLLVDHVWQAGLSTERIMLLGFSQGACLAAEYTARNARRYGGVACLSGGLIGPDDTPRDYAGSFDGTPIFLGCSDVDFHIPRERVEETAQIFERMGADVTMRLYPNMGHTVNEDELEFVRTMVEQVLV